jgi:hypothetical protein
MVEWVGGRFKRSGTAFGRTGQTKAKWGVWAHVSLLHTVNKPGTNSLYIALSSLKYLKTGGTSPPISKYYLQIY